MVKNWAEVSSDEEDVHAGADEGPVTAVDPDVLQKEIAAENRAFADGQDDDDDEDGGGPPQKRTYVFPTEPPYTAYVGNLSYNIVEPRELQDQLLDCVQRLLPGDTTINIVDTRIMMDRKHPQQQHGGKPRHRGFAYVQVETLDMLKALVQLNDHAAMIDGRNIVLDTSVTNDKRNRGSGRGGNRNRDSGQKLPDGSQFRGGRFNKPGGSGRGSGSGGRRESDNNNGDGPPMQRTSLKLAPRTKPVEEGGNNSASDIFGGGKARDEQVWQSRRRSQSDKPSGGRGSGGGSGGRGHNKGSSQKTSGRKDRKAEGKTAPAKQPVVTPKTAAPAPAPPAEKKVVNKFAALDFSDSD